MTDLLDFLLARIAEDEEAVAEHVEKWGPLGGGGAFSRVLPDDEYAQMIIDPARILAECEAKRRIVEGFGCYITTRDAGWMIADVFKLLALPYADHPDYRDEWRP